jgi:hypothetical protein
VYARLIARRTVRRTDLKKRPTDKYFWKKTGFQQTKKRIFGYVCVGKPTYIKSPPMAIQILVVKDCA